MMRKKTSTRLIIINRRKPIKAVDPSGMFSHYRGMMFKDWNSERTAMLFHLNKTCNFSIWSPFCPDMNLIFLDGVKGETVIHVERLRPWKKYKPHFGFDRFIEMDPAVPIKSGDKIKIQ